MMGGEAPINLGIEQKMASGEFLRHRGDDLAGRAAAAIPGDGERARVPQGACKSRRVPATQVDGFDPPDPLNEPPGLGEGAEAGDARTVERFRTEHDLEAVLIRRIVRPGHHHAALQIQLLDGEIEQRCRPKPEPRHDDAAAHEPFDQRALQGRGGEAAVIADGEPGTALGHGHRADGATQSQRIALVQRLADASAQIILAQQGRVEPVPLQLGVGG